MPLEVKIRRFSGAVSGALFAISALAASAFVPASAAAQTGEPVKIGYSMSLTGGLAPNGRSALLAQKIWGCRTCLLCDRSLPDGAHVLTHALIVLLPLQAAIRF